MQSRADWFATSGARELRDSSTLEYREYLDRSQYCLKRHFEEDLRQIELDLPRTDESIRLFLLSHDERQSLATNEELPECVMQQYLPKLKNVLVAYSMRNPRVGYIQGHADVLCFILGNSNKRRNEEEAFWVYASVIERVFPEDFFSRTPKLHGFQVDCKLYHELVLEILVPLFPTLSKLKRKVDLPLVTTLLSCKWFVSLWVGELPLALLYEVWDAMLRQDDGSILHLLVALHFFHLAIEKIQLYMETDQWDSSYIYKIILNQCQNATNIAPQTLLQQARTLYGLRDESIEDMRATIRRLPQLRKAEVAALAKETHFNRLEMERLQDEFTFLRFQKKTCCRSKLRGLRQEDLEVILSRELYTFLSIASRGTLEEKACLLFQVPNHRYQEYLNKQGITRLAGHRLYESRGNARSELVCDAAKSPLLRKHFQAILLSQTTPHGHLEYTAWLEFALGDSEIAQLMEWNINRSGRDVCTKTRSFGFWRGTSIQPALLRTTSDSILAQQQRIALRRQLRVHIDDLDERIYKEDDQVARKERQRVSLLSKEMTKKFEACWSPAEVETLSRNPFHEPNRVVRAESLYMLWCQCSIS
ncbi:hypothetical protein CCR75_001003 [Bremia lactucae]|uniref:Rab-GAP TBC domain-containing protein n=1 Tax=Bremia lactucae TaxID=4779 RepID=A0A976NY67_BRELC|nr:hypothetical protein CCR75_001003 [Bremia lactucae]